MATPTTQTPATVGGKAAAAIINGIESNVGATMGFQMIPTVTGTGVTVGALGTVTFATTNTGTLKNCFSAKFNNYLIVFSASVSSAAATLSIQPAIAGTPTVTGTYASYFYQGSATGAMSGTFAATATTAIMLRVNGVGGGGGTINIQSPFLAQYTTMQGASMDSAVAQQAFATLKDTSIYDGFTFTFSAAATGSGTISVYGLNNG